jgi:hypothetical protein
MPVCVCLQGGRHQFVLWTVFCAPVYCLSAVLVRVMFLVCFLWWVQVKRCYNKYPGEKFRVFAAV